MITQIAALFKDVGYGTSMGLEYGMRIYRNTGISEFFPLIKGPRVPLGRTVLNEVSDCDNCRPVSPRAPSRTDPRKSVAIMLASLKIELSIMAPEKSAALRFDSLKSQLVMAAPQKVF